jgi:hypothetical protein
MAWQLASCYPTHGVAISAALGQELATVTSPLSAERVPRAVRGFGQGVDDGRSLPAYRLARIAVCQIH